MASKTVTRSLKIVINDKEIDNSITKINKEIRQLRKNLAAANNPADRKKLNAELEKAYQARRKINEELRGTQGLLSKIKSQLGPVGAGMLAAFSTAAVISFAGQIIDTIKLFRELKQETKLLTGLQDEMLDKAVAGTKALADTFETDYKENLLAANTLVQNFDVSYEEALKTMEKGYLAGANVSGDMLQQIKEYAPLMKEANIELDEMVALIAQTEKQGIFNDKGIDAIKEGMLRIREGTNATREAIDGLGIDSTKLYDGIQDGSTSYFEAMQLVSTKLNEIGDQSPAVGAAIADIFGGPGEDAGLQYLQNIKDIDLELDNLIDTQDEYTRLKQEEIDVNTRLNETWVDLTETGGFFNQIAVTGKGILADVLSSFRDIDKVLADNQARNNQEQLDANEQEFRDHMERMKKVLGDRYDFETLKANFVKNISDSSIQNQILALEELEAVVVKSTTSKIDKVKELEKKAAEKKAERDRLAEERKAERDTEKQQKKLEKLRESEEEYEALQRQLKAESDQRTFDLEEENRLEEEAQRLEQEILNAEDEEVRTQLIIERAQFIATEQLRIQKQKDIERAKLAGATEAEIFAIKQKYLLAEKKINLDFSKDQKELKFQEVKWEDMTQNQKIDLVRSGLSQAAELFNQNTAAYKAIKITETLMTTYQAAMNSYNSLSVIPIVGPVLGGIAAAAAVAAGLAQVNKIKNTKSERMPRYDTGGFTGSGFGISDDTGHKVAGIVHDGEYVVPKFVLQDTTDPTMPAVIQYLEAKRTGSSFVDGGETSLDSIPPNEATVDISEQNFQQNAVLSAILFRLENPLPGIAVLDNEEALKIKELHNEVEQARNGAIVN